MILRYFVTYVEESRDRPYLRPGGDPLKSDNLRVMIPSMVRDTRAEAEALLNEFLEAGELSKVYSRREIESMRVDAFQCYDNGQYQGVYVEEAAQGGPKGVYTSDEASVRKPVGGK